MLIIFSLKIIRVAVSIASKSHMFLIFVYLVGKGMAKIIEIASFSNKTTSSVPRPLGETALKPPLLRLNWNENISR